MRELLQQISQYFRPERSQLSDAVVQGFMLTLEAARMEDVPCSEVFSRLDEYVEREFSGQDAARLMPLLREHLDLCPDCCEEYEALLRVLQATSEGADN